MSYKFFQNKKCEYFPCHKNVDEEKFNCLFCYCPLYMMGENCGGKFKYYNGYKDCSDCVIPHVKGDGYDFIQEKMKIVVELMKKKD